jgi:hypothetical protein
MQSGSRLSGNQDGILSGSNRGIQAREPEQSFSYAQHPVAAPVQSARPPYRPCMGDTSGTDVVLAGFTALDTEEQDEAFAQISEVRMRRLAGEDSETGRVLRSLCRVRDHLGEAPNSTTYREAWAELRKAGEAVESLPVVIRHFGSWRRAAEALMLSSHTSARKIDARFSRRRLGKVWRYTAKTLEETLRRCVEAIGHVPQVAEFEHWRARELELARARGDDALHLPSATPYRRRYGTWEKALLTFGYTPDEVAERLEHR